MLHLSLFCPKNDKVDKKNTKYKHNFFEKKVSIAGLFVVFQRMHTHTYNPPWANKWYIQ